MKLQRSIGVGDSTLKRGRGDQPMSKKFSFRKRRAGLEQGGAEGKTRVKGLARIGLKVQRDERILAESK